MCVCVECVYVLCVCGYVVCVVCAGRGRLWCGGNGVNHGHGKGCRELEMPGELVKRVVESMSGLRAEGWAGDPLRIWRPLLQ